MTVALVTGAGAADGIGIACARALGAAGLQVVVTSTTERMRRTGRRARAPPWSAVKQTTSQRPTPGRRAKGPASGTGPGSEASDGKRFSNTTTL